MSKNEDLNESEERVEIEQKEQEDQVENIDNALSDGNYSSFNERKNIKDEEVKSSGKIRAKEILTEDIGEPPDTFFDDLLNDDFLDSLAVVDTWNPNVDDSSSSDLEKTEKSRGAAESGSNSVQLSEKERQRECGRVNEKEYRNSDRTRRRDGSECRKNSEYSRRDDRRRQSASVRRQEESQRKTSRKRYDSRERSVERIASRKKKGSIEKESKTTDKDTLRDRSAERKPNRRDRHNRDSTERITHRGDRFTRDDRERDVLRREDNRENAKKYLHKSIKDIQEKGTEKSTEKYRKYRDKSEERNIYRREKDRNLETPVHREDKNKDIDRPRHRYSYQYRSCNRQRSVDNVRERTDLKQNSTDICLEERAVEKRKSCNDQGKSVDKKEIQREFIHQKHNIEEEITCVPISTTRHEDGNKFNEVVSAISDNQSHGHVKPSNPPTNNTVLDTCIKELNDLVPPGTEEEFILLPSKDAATKAVVDQEKGDVMAKEVISDNSLHQEKISHKFDCGKLAKHPACNENMYLVNRLEEQKAMEIDKDVISSSESNRRLYKGTKRLSSPFEENMRSESRDSEEKRKRMKMPLKSFSDEERVYEEARAKNELFNEFIRKKRYNENDKREIFYVDSQRLNRKKDVQSDNRISSSGDRDRGRLTRSRSKDRQSEKTSYREKRQYENIAGRSKRRNYIENDRRLVRSFGRDNHYESSATRSISKSHSRERQYRKLSSKHQKEVRPRRSVSQERKRRPSQRSRQSPSWYKYKHRRTCNSSASVERMSFTSGLSFELSSLSERERWQSFSRSPSRERRYVYRRCLRSYSYSHISSESALSRSHSLSSLSNDSHYRKRTQRKRSPFWKEIERKFANDLSKSVFSKSANCAQTAFPEDYNSSIQSGTGTFVPTVPYPTSSGTYSHGYPTETDFMQPFHPGAITQPPPSGNNIDHPLYSSAPSTFSEHVSSLTTPTHVPPPVPASGNNIAPSPHVSDPPHYMKPTSSFMAPAHVLSPLPTPVYNEPHPAVYTEFTGQSNISNKIPSPENVFKGAVNSKVMLQPNRMEPSQVSPSLQIPPSYAEKRISLSSLLEASVKGSLSTKDSPSSRNASGEFKVGDSEMKQMTVDPKLVARCEEMIHALHADDGFILAAPGYFVLQEESSRPYSPTTAILEASLEESKKFRSPILRTPDVQLRFTSAPVCEKVAISAKESCRLSRKDFTASLKKWTKHVVRSNIVTSSHKSTSTKGLKSYKNSSTMTDCHGDDNKVSDEQTRCVECLKHRDRIMIWNYTQTPQITFRTIGVQISLNDNKCSELGIADELEKVDDVKSGNVSNEVDKNGSASQLDPNNKISTAEAQINLHSDKESTTVTESNSSLNISKEVFESRQHAPSLSKGVLAHGGTFYKTSTYQAYFCNKGKNSHLKHPSSSSSYKVALSPAKLHVNTLNPPPMKPLAPPPPKGILKSSISLHQSVSSQQQQSLTSQLQMQLPQPTILKQTFLKCDLPGFSALSSLQSPKPLSLSGGLKDFRSASGLCNLRSGSSSSATFGSSSAIRPNIHMLAGARHGSMLIGSTNTSFPQFGKSGMGNAANQHPNFFPPQQAYFSSSFRGSSSVRGISVNPVGGHHVQQFQQKSSMNFQQLDKSQMNPREASMHR